MLGDGYTKQYFPDGFPFRISVFTSNLTETHITKFTLQGL